MTSDPSDAPWLDAVLSAGRAAAIADDGFAAAVLARIAAPLPVLPPQAALAAAQRAERSERSRTRWTIGAAAVGIAVAAAAAGLAGAPEVAKIPLIGADVLALLVVSCSLAWLAIANGRGASAW